MMRYVSIWLLLAALTTATFLLARAPLGPLHSAVALTIATAKSTLVVLFFMHLVEVKGAPRFVFAAAVVFVILLLVFTVGDVLTRFPLALPRAP